MRRENEGCAGDRWFLDSFNFSTGGTSTLMNRSSLHPLGRWYHVAAVYDGKRFSNYVNGVRQVEGRPLGPLARGGELALTGLAANVGFDWAQVAAYLESSTDVQAVERLERPELDPARALGRLHHEPAL